MKAVLTVPLLLAAAATLAALLGSSDELQSGFANGDDLIGQIFGESRAVISSSMFLRADLYYHGGVAHADHDDDHHHDHGLRHQAAPRDPGLPTEQDHDYDDHDDDHHGHAHHGWIARLDPWARINRHRVPQEHTHLHGERLEKEVLPWIWASIRSDPTNITAYTVGGYWLAYRMERPHEALELIKDGVRRNPGNAELEFTRGTLLFHVLEQTAPALQALKQAREKWLLEAAESATPPDTAIYRSILTYLGHLSEIDGDIEEARQYYREALQYVGDRPRIRQNLLDKLEALDRQPDA